MILRLWSVSYVSFSYLLTKLLRDWDLTLQVVFEAETGCVNESEIYIQHARLLTRDHKQLVWKDFETGRYLVSGLTSLPIAGSDRYALILIGMLAPMAFTIEYLICWQCGSWMWKEQSCGFGSLQKVVVSWYSVGAASLTLSRNWGSCVVSRNNS